MIGHIKIPFTVKRIRTCARGEISHQQSRVLSLHQRDWWWKTAYLPIRKTFWSYATELGTHLFGILPRCQHTSPPSLQQSAGHHIKIQCCQPRTYLRQPVFLTQNGHIAKNNIFRPPFKNGLQHFKKWSKSYSITSSRGVSFKLTAFGINLEPFM